MQRPHVLAASETNPQSALDVRDGRWGLDVGVNMAGQHSDGNKLFLKVYENLNTMLGIVYRWLYTKSCGTSWHMEHHGASWK